MAPFPFKALLLFLISFQSIASAPGKPAEALVVNSGASDTFLLTYKNILLDNKNTWLAPGDTLRIPFDENSFSPVSVSFVVPQGKPAVIGVLPGDLVQVRHDKRAGTYEFTGRYQAELDFYKRLWHSRLGLNGAYFEILPGNMPTSMEGFIGEWQKIREEGDELIKVLQAQDGMRPEVEAYLERELRLRIFSVLTLPAIYHKNQGLVQPFPQFYRDTVIAQARLLPSLQALPASSSERHLHALRSFILYRALDQGSIPAFALQYELAKQEYTGQQREWACYSILEHARAMQKDVSSLLKDYRSWAAPESKFLKKLTGEETPVTLDRQLIETDVLVGADNTPLLLAELLARHKGKVIYIDFWASWCLPCLMELPASQEVRKQYSDQELVMVYLSVDRDAARWQKASRKLLQGVAEQYRFEDEEKSKFIRHFGIKSIPRYMIIDQAGKVRFADAPGPNNFMLKEVLSHLLDK